MNKNQIEILIPTYNEEKNINLVIKELNAEGFSNITILDANSEDKTVEIQLFMSPCTRIFMLKFG